MIIENYSKQKRIHTNLALVFILACFLCSKALLGKEYQLKEIEKQDPISIGSLIKSYPPTKTTFLSKKNAKDKPTLVLSQTLNKHLLMKPQIVSAALHSKNSSTPTRTPNKQLAQIEDNKSLFESELNTSFDIEPVKNRHFQSIAASQKNKKTEKKPIKTLANLGSKQPKERLEINFSESSNNLSITPNKLSLGKGEKVNLSLNFGKNHAPKLFIRNSELLEFGANKSYILSKEVGTSEIIVVFNDKISIIPVEIKSNNNLDNLQIASELSSTNNLLPNTSLANLNESFTTNEGRFLNEQAFQKIYPDKNSPVHRNIGSNYFQLEDKKLSFKKIKFQLIDEQSVDEKKERIPVKGIKISIIGTEFKDYSDPQGLSSEIFVPENSRFFVITQDPTHLYKTSINEVFSNDLQWKDGLITLKLMQNLVFHNLAKIAEINKHESSASLCGRVLKNGSKAFEGVSVKVFGLEKQAYYFNRYGLLDPMKLETGPGGRFCFFQLEPGPLAFDFSENQKIIDTIPLAVFKGKHTEEDFVLLERETITTHLAAMATAQEQRSSGLEHSNLYKPINMANLLAIGSGNIFRQENFGIVSSINQLPRFKGRSCFMSNAAEFEPTYYCKNSDRTKPFVTPLVPNSFIEKMSYYYNVELQLDPIELNPLLGTVIVEHGHMLGQDRNNKSTVNIQLINEKAQSVGDGVHYGESPSTKAIFFNVPPGNYSVIAKTSDEYWLAIDTIMVYSKTLSYLPTGSKLIPLH